MLNCNEELIFKTFSSQSLALHWEAGPRESNENLSVTSSLKGVLNTCHGEEGASLELLSHLSLWKDYKVFNAWHRLQFSVVFHLLKDASVMPSRAIQSHFHPAIQTATCSHPGVYVHTHTHRALYVTQTHVRMCAHPAPLVEEFEDKRLLV